MPDQQWQVRIEGALNAHFKSADGTPRPGIDWKIGLRRGSETATVIVRAYLADGVSTATRDNTAYQGEVVIGYVSDRLAAGWTPSDGPLPGVTIPEPRRTAAPPPPRRGLLGRLLGR